MRISDWSSDVCSSDLGGRPPRAAKTQAMKPMAMRPKETCSIRTSPFPPSRRNREAPGRSTPSALRHALSAPRPGRGSEEHTSELQSLMRISYAVFCLNKKINTNKIQITEQQKILIQYTHTYQRNHIET